MSTVWLGLCSVSRVKWQESLLQRDLNLRSSVTESLQVALRHGNLPGISRGIGERREKRALAIHPKPQHRCDAVPAGFDLTMVDQEDEDGIASSDIGQLKSVAVHGAQHVRACSILLTLDGKTHWHVSAQREVGLSKSGRRSECKHREDKSDSSLFHGVSFDPGLLLISPSTTEATKSERHHHGKQK